MGILRVTRPIHALWGVIEELVLCTLVCEHNLTDDVRLQLHEVLNA